MRRSRSPPLPTWNGEALMTASSSAPASLASRAGSSNQASSQISRPTLTLSALAHLEHADALARREVAPLVEHLVVGQLALGIGLQHAALAEHAGRVVALLHRDRLAAQASPPVRVADHHHVRPFNPASSRATRFHGIIAGSDEGGAQEQVFGRVAANRQLGREQQPRAVGVGRARGIDDFLRVARHVANDKLSWATQILRVMEKQ